MTLVLPSPHPTRVYSRRPQTRNIVSVYLEATGDEKTRGRAWYDVARATALRIDPTDVERAAAVLAIYSPKCGWKQNVELAEHAYKNGKALKGMTDHKNKVNRIFNGEAPLDVLGGNKVRNFYGAIIGDPSAVVIDRHAFDIAIGRPTNDNTRGPLFRKDALYAEFAKKYVLAAERISKIENEPITAFQVQAVTWLAWRRIKGLDMTRYGA